MGKSTDEGLALFQAGDLAGAARVWFGALQSDPGNAQLVAYLQHVRRLAPEVYEKEEKRRAGAQDAPQKPQAGIPLPATQSESVGEGGSDGFGGRGPEVVSGPPPAAPAPAASAALAPKETAVDEPIPIVAKSGWGTTVEVKPVTPGLGLGLVSVPAPQPSQEPESSEGGSDDLQELETRIKDQFELDDFSGVIDTAERMLRLAKEHALAMDMRERARTRLEGIYRSKIGDVGAVPRVLVASNELIWLDLDHRSGFVLAQIDGISSYEEIMDITGMDRLETCRILANLVQRGVIGNS